MVRIITELLYLMWDPITTALGQSALTRKVKKKMTNDFQHLVLELFSSQIALDIPTLAMFAPCFDANHFQIQFAVAEVEALAYTSTATPYIYYASPATRPLPQPLGASTFVGMNGMAIPIQAANSHRHLVLAKKLLRQHSLDAARYPPDILKVSPVIYHLWRRFTVYDTGPIQPTFKELLDWANQHSFLWALLAKTEFGRLLSDPAILFQLALEGTFESQHAVFETLLAPHTNQGLDTLDEAIHQGNDYRWYMQYFRRACTIPVDVYCGGQWHEMYVPVEGKSKRHYASAMLEASHNPKNAAADDVLQRMKTFSVSALSQFALPVTYACLGMPISGWTYAYAGLGLAVDQLLDPHQTTAIKVSLNALKTCMSPALLVPLAAESAALVLSDLRRRQAATLVRLFGTSWSLSGAAVSLFSVVREPGFLAGLNVLRSLESTAVVPMSGFPLLAAAAIGTMATVSTYTLVGKLIQLHVEAKLQWKKKDINYIDLSASHYRRSPELMLVRLYSLVGINLIIK